MFRFLREWTKSTAVKRQETLNAYLDEELSPQDRVAFERLLADDAVLQQELADRELIKSQLRQLPRVAVPRNFILDASKYRRPAKRPLITYYPVLRGATALTAVIFIFTLGWGMMGSGGSYSAVAPAQEMAVEMVVETVVEEMEVEETAAETEEVAAEAEMPEMERMPADGIVEAEEAPAAPIAEAFEETVEDMAADAAAGASVVVEDDELVEEMEYAEEEMVDEGVADNAVKSTPVEEDVVTIATVVMETAVFTETAVVSTLPPPTPPKPAPSPALTSGQFAQIGLFILFVTLLTLTIYVRRQR